MELLKNIKKSFAFKDRYSDMEGADDGFDRKELRKLKSIKKGGGRVDEDRLDYLQTIRDERTRAIGTGAAALGGTVLGAVTGNPALIKGSLGMMGGYVAGEMGELEGPNDGVGQQLSTQDALSLASPFLAGIGGGSNKSQDIPGVNNQPISSDFDFDEHLKTLPTYGMKQGGKLRYNPRKYDYIKGNTFGYK